VFLSWFFLVSYNDGMHDFAVEKRDALLQHLRKHVAGEVRFDSTSRKIYSTDASIYRIQPLGVVIPSSPEDLLAAVQIALETHTPIVPRGGGTSLSGQSIGPGLIVDCSKYLNSIGPIDVAGQKVRVQPGVVLDHLNSALAIHGLQFGPEVATSNRATLGGMLGNNSAGARSIVYGKMVDHVLAVKAILSDGSVGEFDYRTVPHSLLYRESLRIINQNADEIRNRFPRIIRRVSGYNLVDVLENPKSQRQKSLVPLLVGSEGTLCFASEIELNLVPRPKHRGILVPHFESLACALDALGACLEFAPSAVELMDTMLIALARQQRSFREMMAAIHGTPAALLMVEFASDEAAEVNDRIDRLRNRLKEIPGVTAVVPAIDPAIREPLWNLRRAAMPLLYGMPGDRKPITFCEDCAVSPARLPEFALQFREILRRHGTDGAFYGHASVGCLHIRPVLNLKDPDDVTRMRAIMEDVTDLVLAHGGSLSGEHGDGLVRSEWNRKMFGPVVYEAFRQIKHTFDPHNLFNPGKVVDAPPMTESLRYENYRPSTIETIFDYRKQEGFFRSIELCNGAGVCRKTQGGAMCPSFRATRDERDNTRGRANALRLALAEGPVNGQSPLSERWLMEVMDLCLSCKACKSECPSNVDLAKLKAEFLQAYYARRTRPWGHHFVAHVDRINRFGAKIAPVMNWLNRRGIIRWMLEKVAGIDRRRSLPELHFNHFRKWFANRRPAANNSSMSRVLLFDDCFTTFNEPEIGKSAVAILDRLGVGVELVNPICCGRALISKGFLKEAQALAAAQLPELARRVEGGIPILGMEPSCVLTLMDEWPELVPGPEAEKVAGAVQLAEVWVGEKLRERGLTEATKSSEVEKCLFHGHCHQRALCGVRGTTQALEQVLGLDVQTLDAGCCGMAGAFGFEKEHYDLSVKIANLQLIPALKKEPDAIIAATGTSCRHQIRDLTGRKALHPLQIIAERME
jgi:FAD/FMN-containing dehydrogenase/Fe-S oxidoreductase